MTFDEVLKEMRENGKGATRTGLRWPLRIKNGLIYEGTSKIWVPYQAQIVADDWRIVEVEQEE